MIGLFTKKRSSGEEIVHEAKSWIKFEAVIAMSRLIYVAASKSIGFGASVAAEALPALWVAGSVVKELHHATMGMAGVFVAEKCLEKCMDVYGASHAPAEIARKAQYLPLLPAIVKSKSAAEKTYFDLLKESFDLLDSVTRALPASTRFTEHIRKNINTDTLVAGVQALIEASGCEESPKKTVVWLREHPKEGSRVFRKAVRQPRKEVRLSNQERVRHGANEPKVSSGSAQKITTTDMLRVIKKKRQAEQKGMGRPRFAKQAAM